jgi:LEA14-like dessication related protein
MLFKEPEITLKNITIRSISLQEIGLDVTLDVNNPNVFGVKLKSIVFDVYYQRGDDWIYVSHGEGGGYDIRPGMNEVTVPVAIKSSALPGAGIAALLNGEITLQVRGTAVPDFFGFAPKVPFNYTTSIPVNLPGL